jgi:hypothetical protein
MAQVRWKKLFFQASMWLVAEVFLTCIGTDDLADYSEFQFTYREEGMAQLEDGISFNRLVGPTL